MPACPGETFQCFIKRDRANMTFHLFISLSPPVLPVENGKFLLSAKGTHRGTHTEYIISSDADNMMSCSSSSYVGKIRSNFLGNKFIIYDSQPQPCTHIPTSARRFLSKKISHKVPTGSYNIAQVTYTVNLTGVIQPRKMNCIMHSIPASALDAGQTPLKPRNLENSFRSLSVDCPADYQFSEIGAGNDNEGNKSKPLVLKNKPPRWHEQLKCWCLNFHGRVHVASVKNFQLVDARDPDIVAPVYLQFGKVSKDKDTFIMDYKYPLSAFQAFAICLSSFSNKLLCDH